MIDSLTASVCLPAKIDAPFEDLWAAHAEHFTAFTSQAPLGAYAQGHS